MSRVIVRDLPSDATEAQIRSFFESKGQVTDVKLMRWHDGISRRFAFVGFKSTDEAGAAVEYFNGAYMKTARLKVEISAGLDSTKSLRKRKSKQHETNHQPSFKKSKGDNEATSTEEAGELQDTGSAEDQSEADGSSDEQAQNQEQGAEPEEVEETPVDDMAWLRSKQKLIKDPTLESDPSAHNLVESTLDSEPEQDELVAEEERDETVDSITATRRLFLRNLSYGVTQDEIQKLMEPFGPTVEVSVPMDLKKDVGKGFAFVRYRDAEDAVEAYKALDGSVFQGRLLHVLPAKPAKKEGPDEFDLQNLSAKDRAKIERQANAVKHTFAWNSLYLNQDAVMQSMSQKLGIPRSELMDQHSSSSAVKQALAEASMLQKIQEFFKSKGVDLASFKTKSLSDKVILVKNIPFGINATEISDLFAKYGEVTRLLMPSEGIVAIVEMATAASAKAAFKNLAFRRLASSILYLQKAPAGCLDESSGTGSGVEEAAAQPNANASEATSAKTISGGDMLLDTSDGTQATGAESTIFIKNLNFKTTVDAIKSLFKNSNGFLSATISTKANPKDPKTRLSMGFGFAEFKSAEDANIAIEAFQNYYLDGHALQLKLSDRRSAKASDAQLGAKPQTSKVVIKNLPFEATQNEVSELLGTYGQLKSVRVPRKFDKQSRGFAFAEFSSRNDAETAVDALRGVHLLGRRLIIELAETDKESPEEQLARLEKKVQKQVEAEKMATLTNLTRHKGIDAEEDLDE